MYAELPCHGKAHLMQPKAEHVQDKKEKLAAALNWLPCNPFATVRCRFASLILMETNDNNVHKWEFPKIHLNYRWKQRHLFLFPPANRHVCCRPVTKSVVFNPKAFLGRFVSATNTGFYNETNYCSKNSNFNHTPSVCVKSSNNKTEPQWAPPNLRTFQR